MNIIRKIKLNKLDCYQIKDSEKELYEFIKSELFNLRIIEIDEYPHLIYYFNKMNECVFIYNTIKDDFYNYNNSNRLWVRFSLWLKFQSIFEYKYEKICKIISHIVEFKYKLLNTIPSDEYQLINQADEIYKKLYEYC